MFEQGRCRLLVDTGESCPYEESKKIRTGLRVPAPQPSATMISIARSQRSVSLREKSAFSLPAFLFSLRKKEMMKENFIIIFCLNSFSTFLFPKPKRKVAKEKGLGSSKEYR